MIKKTTMTMRFNRFLITMLGFKIDYVHIPPEAQKCVLLFAPHTSMLDFVIGKIALAAMGVKTVFLIKKEIFFFPLGLLLKYLGGMPIDRKHVRKFPIFAAELINNSREIAFLMAPEGSRQRVDNWKKGFYFIAQQANVPIVLAYLDYHFRRGGVGNAIYLTGNMDRDMEEIQKFYYGMRGYHKGHFNLENMPLAHPEWLLKKQKGGELIFATHNLHKKTEVQSIFGKKFIIKCLQDLDFHEEIAETGNTLQENALQKARFVYQKFGHNCFADDTGLEVDALENAPGVYSARYAGEGCSYADNVDKLLQELAGIENRKACFTTIIALIVDGKEYLFEGKIEGNITQEPRGNNGFGYDPVFQPIGEHRTFGELSADEKNGMSHRAKALQAMVELIVDK